MKTAQNTKILLGIVVILGVINVQTSALAIETGNLTIKERSEICLTESREIMNRMLDENFSIQRINSTIKKAQEIYDANLILKKSKKNNDFSQVVEYCQNIKEVKEQAFIARDELFSIQELYQEINETGVNMTEADKLINEIRKEIQNERYEKAREKIPEAHEKISEIQASATTLKLFYAATTRSLKNFFLENWTFILYFIVIVFILFIVYRKTIRRGLIKRKIRNLEAEKQVLKTLIQKTQKDYFQFNKISTGIYNTRTKQFSEMIRDIDRQIPLLKEELAKIRTKKHKLK